MTACVEVLNGRYAGSSQLLELGDVCRVGARVGSDLWLADDPQVEPAHCAITFERRGLLLHDLSQGGTFVNGERTSRVALRHGDWIVAGTSLLVLFERGQSEEGFETVCGRLAAQLAGYCYLGEAAESEMPSHILAELGDDCATVGEIDVRLASVPAEWPGLRWFLRGTWGRGRGLFLRTDAELSELSRHFDAVAKRTTGFRFFDPRVLRVMLPECNAGEWRELFGPAVVEVILESQLPHSALVFRLMGQRISAELRRFSTSRQLIPRQAEILEALEASGSPQVAYSGLLTSVGLSSEAALGAGETYWHRYRVKRPEARVQLELLRAALGDECVLPEMEQVLPSAVAPDGALDAFVAALNERRG